jgi:hypothetical protein
MTATYSKPTKVPRWADTSTNITEPLEGKKDEGWLFEEVPPSSWENWRTNLIGSWMKWFDERFFDGTTKDQLLIKSPGSAADALRITDTYVKSELEFRVEGDDLGMEVDGVASRRIYFDAAKQNWLGWNIATSRMELYAAGVLALWADATQCYINGDIVIGDDLSVPGGLAVGIATPTFADDVIQLGDSDSRWEFNSGNPQLVFDHAGASPDALSFTRATSKLGFQIAGSEVWNAVATGVEIAKGLNVGFTGTISDDKVCVGDADCNMTQWSTYAALSFASGDAFQYDRTANELSFLIGSSAKFRVVSAGVTLTGGIHAGALTGISGNGRITCTDLMQAGTSVRATTDLWTYAGNLYFSNDGGDSVVWDGTNLKFNLNTVEEMRLSALGLAVGKGLQVGFIGTPTADRIAIGDAAFYAELATDAIINFDSTDYIKYSRSSDRWEFWVSSVNVMNLAGTGLVLNTIGLTVNGGDLRVGTFDNTKDLILASDAGIHPNQTTKGHFHCSQLTGRLRSGDGTNVESYPVNFSRALVVMRSSLGVISSITVPAGITSAGSLFRVRAYLIIDGGSGTIALKMQGVTIGSMTWSGADRMLFQSEFGTPSLPSGTAIMYGGTFEFGLSFGHGVVNIATMVNTFNAIPIDVEITSYVSGNVTLACFTVDLI